MFSLGTDDLATLVTLSINRFPILLVWGFGIGVAVSLPERPARVVKIVIGALLISVATVIASSYSQLWIMRQVDANRWSQNMMGIAYGIKAMAEILLNAISWVLVLVAALSSRRTLGESSEHETADQIRTGRILRRRYWIAFGLLIIIESMTVSIYLGWRPSWLFVIVVLGTVVMPIFLAILLRASRIILHYALGKRILLALIVLFVPVLSLVAILYVDSRISRICRAAA